MFKLIYNDKMPAGVRQFLADQMQWSRNQTHAHAQDPYWQQLGMARIFDWPRVQIAVVQPGACLA